MDSQLPGKAAFGRPFSCRAALDPLRLLAPRIVLRVLDAAVAAATPSQQQGEQHHPHTTRPLPCRLASYSAASAHLSRPVADIQSSGNTATPTLAETRTSTPG